MASEECKWEVFVCHRGPDTKMTFVDGLAKYELAGRRVFVDNISLGKGQETWPTILAALRQARIVVVVLSPRFQESAWCMEELRIAMKEVPDRVRTIFYNFEAKANEAQLEVALAQLIEIPVLRSGGPDDVLGSWRKAIQAARGSQAWLYDPKRSDREQQREVAAIVEHELPSKPLSTGRELDMVERVQALQQELTATPQARVRVLGVTGMGGIGKTTLAKALYDELSLTGDYERSCFVEDVRAKMAEPQGAVRLQHIMLKKLTAVSTQPLTIKDGRQSLHDQLASTKVLLVLDDVEAGHVEKLVHVAALGEGSTVVIASRDRAVLVAAGCMLIHSVSFLSTELALKLFLLHAGPPPSDLSLETVNDIVEKCAGLPLSLKVMGAMVKGKQRVMWAECLNQLRKAGTLVAAGSGENLFKQLRISVDALDDEERKMFLDVACMLVGRPVDEAIGFWKRLGWPGLAGLEVLLDRCLLITEAQVYSESGAKVLGMHDQLRDMGRGLERTNLTLKPVPVDIRQRVWDCKLERLHTSRANWSRWRSLRLVNLSGTELPALPASLLTVSSLEWLDLSSCDIADLSACWPDAGSSTPTSLVHLDLSRCTKLIGLPERLGELTGLASLNLQFCERLTVLPEQIGKLTGLASLNLQFCERLDVLLDCIGDLTGLTSLNLSGCEELTTLPERIGNLTGLTSLDLRHCGGLTALPERIGDLMRLSSLNLLRCKQLTALPERIGDLTGLSSLHVSYCGLAALPERIGDLTGLTNLDLSDCLRLKALPARVCNLRELASLNLSGCVRLTALPEGISNLTGLSSLNLGGCKRLLAAERAARAAWRPDGA